MMNLQQIKDAVTAGKIVLYNGSYRVIHDNKDQWLIKSSNSNHCIGLTWEDGVTLNGKEEKFTIDPTRINWEGAIWKTEELPTDPTYRLINRIELASELAEKAMDERYGKERVEAEFWMQDIHGDEGDKVHTEEGQNIYDALFEYYEEIIINCSAPHPDDE